MRSKNFVVFDCDGGSDDAWALLLLLKADEENYINILGISICGSGNTTLHHAANNILRVLEATDRDDIPIFLGPSESLLSSNNLTKLPLFHGKDGFGDILLKDDDVDVRELAENLHAVEAINQFCLEHPREVTVIAVGPLTNIALCYNMYGKEFERNVKEIYIMGGNYQGVGNCSSAAEFNFFADPEAAHIVLTKSKCPITLLPWEPCMADRFCIPIKWRLEELGYKALSNSAVRMLNMVEAAQYLSAGYTTWNPCDALLVATFIFQTKVATKESMWHCLVDLSGHTRGQMVLDHLQEVDKNPNVRIIELVDAEFFQKVAEWAAGLRESPMKL